MKLTKEGNVDYTAKEISKSELYFIRNLIIAAERPCKLCIENREECGKYGVHYRMCNELVKELDDVLGWGEDEDNSQ